MSRATSKKRKTTKSKKPATKRDGVSLRRNLEYCLQTSLLCTRAFEKQGWMPWVDQNTTTAEHAAFVALDGMSFRLRRLLEQLPKKALDATS